jgi:hypothetical protein
MGGVRPNASENSHISPSAAVWSARRDGSRPRRQPVLPERWKSAKILMKSGVIWGIPVIGYSRSSFRWRWLLSGRPLSLLRRRRRHDIGDRYYRPFVEGLDHENSVRCCVINAYRRRDWRRGHPSLVVISRISLRIYKVGIIYTAGVIELIMPWILRNFVPNVGP